MDGRAAFLKLSNKMNFPKIVLPNVMLFLLFSLAESGCHSHLLGPRQAHQIGTQVVGGWSPGRAGLLLFPRLYGELRSEHHPSTWITGPMPMRGTFLCITSTPSASPPSAGNAVGTRRRQAVAKCPTAHEHFLKKPGGMQLLRGTL